MTYEAGTYVKGDKERVAKNARQAVALVFEGFKLKSTEVEESAPVAQPHGDEPVTDEPAVPQAPKPAPPKQRPANDKD